MRIHPGPSPISVDLKYTKGKAKIIAGQGTWTINDTVFIDKSSLLQENHVILKMKMGVFVWNLIKVHYVETGTSYMQA